MARGDVPLILASSSPRRRELLRQAGYRFLVKAAPVDEDAVDASLAPAVRVESLAYLKAMVAIEVHGLRADLVLGADTAVELGGRMIGKPADEADARRILSELSGSEHHVLTGLALVDAAGGRRWIAHDSTAVRMRPMTADEIAAYVASGEAMGKAGAYALQETADRYVESIRGSWTNVVGLPMELLERMLKRAGYEPDQFKA